VKARAALSVVTAVLRRVHLIFSLLKRWDPRHPQGSVSVKHLGGYLEEFTFRFNRRCARRITHGRASHWHRRSDPTPSFLEIVRPCPKATARLAVPPDRHGDPDVVDNTEKAARRIDELLLESKEKEA
jgi:hypothetical protein